MKKKIVSLFLALSLAFSLSVPALAATPEEAQDDAELLYNLGLFLGSSTNPDGTPNFALDRAPAWSASGGPRTRPWPAPGAPPSPMCPPGPSPMWGTPTIRGTPTA